MDQLITSLDLLFKEFLVFAMGIWEVANTKVSELVGNVGEWILPDSILNLSLLSVTLLGGFGVYAAFAVGKFFVDLIS